MNVEQIKKNYDVVDHIEEKIKIPRKPEKGLVLLVGKSGSGKTTILKNWFNEIPSISFDLDKALIENFNSIESGEEFLKISGLRSIPTWFRKYETLSNGEKHRATIARILENKKICVDEFTSTVDRDTAKSLSLGLRKHISKESLFVVSTCHSDIEEWLCPDIVYDTDKATFRGGRFLQRPSILLTIKPANFEDWFYFKNHHYLSSAVSKSCHFYAGYIEDKIVAFYAVIHRCGRDIRSYWAGSRLVVLPEYQGIGIGVKFSNAVAEIYKERGLRFFEKTAHPSLGNYRNKSPLWRPTSTNMVRRTSYMKDGKARVQRGFGKSIEHIERDFKRICFSHEYIGMLNNPKLPLASIKTQSKLQTQ
jgi:ABC-type lipoprotein export system ATPase subunit/GNAT superfamily N-acetyltransferase